MPLCDTCGIVLVNVVRGIIIRLFISFSDLPSSVTKLRGGTCDSTCLIYCPSMAIFEFGFLLTTLAFVLLRLISISNCLLYFVYCIY